MSKLWTIYPPVASPEAAEYDHRDHADLSDDTEPEPLEPPAWETAPALLAELDAEMQRQAEEWAAITGPVAVLPAGGMDVEEIPW